MPFQVYLMPTSASPNSAEVQAELRAEIAADGAKIEADGVTIRAMDGAQVELTRDGEGFLVRRLSPGFCRIVFKTALRTNSTVNRGGSDVTPLKMKGSKGSPLYVDMRTDPIENPAALCERLHGDLVSWDRFIRSMQSEGVMGPDEEVLQPPAEPGTETRLTADPFGVAAHCQTMSTAYDRSGLKVLRTVVSQNPLWGVVWRGDIVSSDHPDYPMRMICWRRRGWNGPGGYQISTQPSLTTDPAHPGQLLHTPPLPEH